MSGDDRARYFWHVAVWRLAKRGANDASLTQASRVDTAVFINMTLLREMKCPGTVRCWLNTGSADWIAPDAPQSPSHLSQGQALLDPKCSRWRAVLKMKTKHRVMYKSLLFMGSTSNVQLRGKTMNMKCISIWVLQWRVSAFQHWLGVYDCPVLLGFSVR